MKQIYINFTKTKQRIVIEEDTEIFGLFVAENNDTLNFHLDVIHKKPELTSLTLIKTILYDEAQFNATGNLIIETGAKYTDAYLRIDALMMSEDAFARVVPSLEITENDVKGGHGATVGEVDKEHLFYLKSRGISQSQAEQLLVNGFIHDILTKVKDKGVLADYKKQLNSIK